MSCKVGIINYGMAGNIHSIKKALEKVGADVKVINNRNDFEYVEKVVIPGVGSFKDAMQELEKDDLIQPLQKAANEKYILGICLGMQIMATLGFEYGRNKGLELINGEVKPIKIEEKIPHMGFNSIEIVNYNDLFKGIEKEEFYFMHSYELVNYTDLCSLTEYAGHKFVSAIKKDNIYGVQFHPEKSREAGLKLFENFLKL